MGHQASNNMAMRNLDSCPRIWELKLRMAGFQFRSHTDDRHTREHLRHLDLFMVESHMHEIPIRGGLLDVTEESTDSR